MENGKKIVLSDEEYDEEDDEEYKKNDINQTYKSQEREDRIECTKRTMCGVVAGAAAGGALLNVPGAICGAAAGAIISQCPNESLRDAAMLACACTVGGAVGSALGGPPGAIIGVVGAGSICVSYQNREEIKVYINEKKKSRSCCLF